MRFILDQPPANALEKLKSRAATQKNFAVARGSVDGSPAIFRRRVEDVRGHLLRVDAGRHLGRKIPDNRFNGCLHNRSLAGCLLPQGGTMNGSRRHDTGQDRSCNAGWHHSVPGAVLQPQIDDVLGQDSAGLHANCRKSIPH